MPFFCIVFFRINVPWRDRKFSSALGTLTGSNRFLLLRPIQQLHRLVICGQSGPLLRQLVIQFNRVQRDIFGLHEPHPRNKQVHKTQSCNRRVGAQRPVLIQVGELEVFNMYR